MSLDLRFERLIAAAPERVFDAFTDPAGQREFYGQDAAGWIVDSRCDLRVGGVWEVDGSSFETTLEFTFEPRGDRTLMTMVHSGFPSEELRDEHTRGLPNAFDRLERALHDPERG